MSQALSGVVVTPLKRIENDRGTLMRMMRSDDPGFQQFGEIYFSGVREGVVKAWRRHNRSTSNLAVPIGRVRLVLFDSRSESPTAGRTMAIEIGEGNYQLVTIPPGLWTGWQGLGSGLSLVANCATEPHDPSEVDAVTPDSGTVPYQFPA